MSKSMPTKDPEKRRQHSKQYYERHKEKWLGEGGYMKQNKSYYTPVKLSPVVFMMEHPSGQRYIGATRSLRNYLGSAHTRKAVVHPIKEWTVTVLETIEEATLSELRERGREYARERRCRFLGETKGREEKVTEQVEDPPSMASTASSLDLSQYREEARRMMEQLEL